MEGPDRRQGIKIRRESAFSNFFKRSNTILTQKVVMIGAYKEEKGVVIMDNQYNYYEPDPSDPVNVSDSVRPDGDAPKNKSGKPKKKLPKAVAVTGLAILFGLVSSVTFQGVNLLGKHLTGGESTESSGSKSTTISNATLTTSSGVVTSDVSTIVDKAMPSVVSITNMSVQQVQNFFGQSGTQEVESTGSGIIVSQNDTELLIVTNNHVVSGYDTLTVTFNDGTSAEANIKGTDAEHDLAVVAVSVDSLSQDTLDAISIATLGDSTKLKVGEPAIAIGNALGYGQSVTTGVISATERQIQTDGGVESSVKLIQTDAAINPGNSGGALLNANGEVIGINSAKLAANEVEGMGYAIPISDVSDIITDLMNQDTKTKVAEDERGYLGIKGLDVTSETNQRFDMPEGVYVSEAIKGYGAEEAGITKGNVITAINGTSVSGMSDLQKELQYYKAGETIKITVQVPSEKGEYQEKTLEVKLSQKPAE